MRSFEERKTEIFRRSEEIILHKKRIRKRIVYTSVPLFIAVIFFASGFGDVYDTVSKKDSILSDGSKEDLTVEKPNDIAPFETAFEAETVTAYVTLLNEADGGITKYCDSETVTAIIDLVDKITAAPPLNNKPDVTIEESFVNNDAACPEKEINCEPEAIFSKKAITVHYGDGTVKKYTYTQSSLVDLSTGRRFTLTNDDINFFDSLIK